MDKVKKVAGSSVGSIVAGLLAVGSSPQEISDVFSCDIEWLFLGEYFFLEVPCFLLVTINDLAAHLEV